MAERFVLVQVKIRTFDRFCSTADPYSKRWKGCGFLQADDAICGLFRANLKGRDVRAERCPSCLALDGGGVGEPNGVGGAESSAGAT